MHGKTIEHATPIPRAVPPSAAKDVEESRQQRQQRSQARFRDRGGIFVPTTRNTLVDILLGRKQPSPKKNAYHRRSRSRSTSVSPQKQRQRSVQPSPTVGKNKNKLSLETSTALRTGRLSVGKAAVRRSPRKGSVPAHERSDEDHPKPKARGRKGKAARPSVEKKGKGKAKVHVSVNDKQELGDSGKPMASSSKPETSKAPPKSSSKAPLKGAHDDEGRLPKSTSKSEGKKLALTEAPNKGKGKGKALPLRDEDEEDDPSLSVLASVVAKDKSRATSRATTAHRFDEDGGDRLSKSKPPKLKRKLSIVEEEEEEETPNPLPRKVPLAPPKYAEEDEPELEPPPPKKRAKTTKTTTKKHNTQTNSTSKVSMPEPDEPSLTKARAAKRKAATPEQPMPEIDESPPKKSSDGKRKTNSMDTKDTVEAPERKAKRAKTTVSVHASPLNEVQNDEVEAEYEGDSHRESKKPHRSKPSNRKPASNGTFRKSHKEKARVPIPDTLDYVIPTKTEVKDKGSGPHKRIVGPRKSAVVRIQEPLPPIEDNDPDPIDFLS